MCLAIYKPAGVKIDETALETGFANNDDGAGYTVRNPSGELKTYKGFFKFKQFISYWRNHVELEAMIHFRWMTSGKRNKDNCHPFRFGPKKSWSMIHNGVLATRDTADMSDTACFTQDVLHELAIRDMIRHNDVIEQLEEEIGLGNKMVIMPPENVQAIILNEKAGFWQNGTWWSNASFEKTVYRWSGNTTYNYGTQAKGAHNWWDVEDDEVEQWTRLTAHSKPKDGEDDEAAYLDYLEKKWQDGLNEPSPKASLVT